MTNPLKFEDEYFNELLAIETTISRIYADNPALLDFHVDKALNGAVRTLSNQQRGRKAPTLKLKDDEQKLYDRFMELTEGQFKGGALTDEDGDEIGIELRSLTIDEMIACFKRIQRSIKLMSDQGRQGYLNFIKQFFGG